MTVRTARSPAPMRLRLIAILTLAGLFGVGLFGHEPPAVSASDVSAVTAGGFHNCALTTDGVVKCWGYNYYGQLGDGTTTDRRAPVGVMGLGSGVAAIAAGHYHTCALTAGGGVKCWGFNLYGALGNGSATDSDTPVDVVGLQSGVTAIAAGYYHTCALTIGGGVKCWGHNKGGQLGDGTTEDRAEPVDVVGLGSGVAALATGTNFTCALTIGGGVKCWGDNGQAQLGDGLACGLLCATPVDVSGLASGVAAVSAGYDHTCALTTVGGVMCWGNNDNGQLGDGSTMDRFVPVGVEGLGSHGMAIAAGSFQTCALVVGGGATCWGWNHNGQLGDGTTMDRAAPVAVVGLTSGAQTIAAGTYHTCALIAGDGMRCWGSNDYGQLGDGTLTQRTAPVDVIGIKPPPTATPTSTGAPSLTPTPTRTPTSTPAGLHGDVNCSGGVDPIDAALILQLNAGLLHSVACSQNADTNHDGQVNSIDAALVLQYAAGLIDTLSS